MEIAQPRNLVIPLYKSLLRSTKSLQKVKVSYCPYHGSNVHYISKYHFSNATKY